MKANLIFAAILFAGLVPACYGEDSTSPAISGTWQMQPDKAVTWKLSRNGNNIHIQELKGSEVLTDYTCNVMGKDCEMKDSGHNEKTSLWFNGDVLMELRTRGDSVTERRFEVAKDGKSMDVQVSAISPPGKSEKLEFAREGSETTAQLH